MEVVGLLVRMLFADFSDQLAGTDFVNVFLARRENFRHAEDIRVSKGFREFIKQRHGTCVGVRLEQTPEAVMRHLLRGFQGCFDFGRMVRVVVDQADTVCRCPDDIETSLGAVELIQDFSDDRRIHIQCVAGREGRQRVGDVVLARHAEMQMGQLFAGFHDIELRITVFIKVEIRRGIGAAGAESERDDPLLVQLLQDTGDKRIGVVGDDIAALRHQTGKLVERLHDVVDILEIIQVVRIDVEDDLDFRTQAQETVHIFTGFCDEITAVADLGVAVEFRKIAADQDGRVGTGFFQDEGDHRGGGGFAVCPGNRDTGTIFTHEGTQGFRAGDHRDVLFFRGDDFRIFRRNRGGIDNQVRSFDVFRGMSLINPDALIKKAFRDI